MRPARALTYFLLAMVVVALFAAWAALPTQRAEAQTTTYVYITLHLIPGINLVTYGTSYVNESGWSISLAGTRLVLEVVNDSSRKPVYTEIVTVNKSGDIKFPVPKGIPVTIWLNATGFGNYGVPVTWINEVTFNSNGTYNQAVTLDDEVIPIVLPNGTTEYVKIAMAYSFLGDGAGMLRSAPVSVSSSANGTVIIPIALWYGWSSPQLKPVSPYLAFYFSGGSNDNTTYTWINLSKTYTLKVYKGGTMPAGGISNFTIMPVGGGFQFVNGTCQLVGLWYYMHGYGVAPGFTSTNKGIVWYDTANEIDPANDSDWIFVPVNWTTGWADIEVNFNKTSPAFYNWWGYMVTTCNQTNINGYLIYNFTSKKWVSVTAGMLGAAFYGAITFNKTFNIGETGSVASNMNGTAFKFLELAGPNVLINLSATGEFYTNVTNGWLPYFMNNYPWPVTLPAKLVIGNHLVLVAINSTKVVYQHFGAKMSVTPTEYAVAPAIYFKAYRYSNSTSTNTYIEILVYPRTYVGNATILNGTVEVILNNGNTNVYTGNVTVSNGVAKVVIGGLSENVNYTLTVKYFNASKTVLSSTQSNTSLTTSVVPASLSTVQVASTTTTTTTTSPSTGTSVSLATVLFIIVVILVIVGVILAAQHHAKRTMFNKAFRYVREE